MADEIRIDIKNRVEVNGTDSAKISQKVASDSVAKTEAYTDKPNSITTGMNARMLFGTGMRLASAVGIDTSSISKLSHYGFSVAKAISGLASGNLKDVIQLALDVIADTISQVRELQQAKAQQENSIDEARIQMGLMDVSNSVIKVKKFSGRVTYGKLGG